MPPAMCEITVEPEGILLVDKPTGLTSHDVVQAVKRLLGVKKAGHLGTLDPMATGLLIICIGAATKAAQFMMDHIKEYEGTMMLGAQTDTWDADGKITAQCDFSSVTEGMVRDAFSSFTGDLELQAPAFSAIKQGGKPLYKKARSGEVVNPPIRKARVYNFDLLGFEPPKVKFRCSVSPGAYVRSLAVEVGKKLEVGAYLEALRRTMSGPYRVEDAASLQKLEIEPDIGLILEKLIPLKDALGSIPELFLDWGITALVQNGGHISESELESGKAKLKGDKNGRLYKAINPHGKVVAIMELSDSKGVCEWKSVRVWEREVPEF